jgi:hypothetical protein
MPAASSIGLLPLILFTGLTNAAAQIILKQGMTGLGLLDTLRPACAKGAS